MSNNTTGEKQFQEFIINELISNNYYQRRDNAHFDFRYNIDKEMFKQFIFRTQSDIMAKISLTRDEAFDKLLKVIKSEINSRGYIDVIKNGIKVNDLFDKSRIDKNDNRIYKIYIIGCPNTDKQSRQYSISNQNIMSVIPEFFYSEHNFEDKNRIDLAIFINGFPVVAIELKLTNQGQTYIDAINQWKNDRNPNGNDLLTVNKGFLVYFAMDDNDCFMTTKLERGKTYFLPFNQGSNGGGKEGIGGNPDIVNNYRTSYIWNNILSQQSLTDILYNFIYEQKDSENNSIIIFPRFHQYDVVTKLRNEMIYNNQLGCNYLIQHSTGSGKSKSISWLANVLSMIRNENNDNIFSSVIVVVDRIVLTRQLLKDINGYGDEKRIAEAESANDLANLINNRKPIIVTTIQKFGSIDFNELNEQVKSVNYAVIADEAHSGETGKNQGSLTEGLSADLSDDIESFKQLRDVSNISFFAFTATPSKNTINIFGYIDTMGIKRPYHIYSMQQAVAEGFILDVLGKDNFYSKNLVYHINTLKNNDAIVDKSNVRQLIDEVMSSDKSNQLVVDTIMPDYIEQIVNNPIKRVKTVNGIEQANDTLRCMVVCGSRKHAYVVYNKIINKIEQLKKENAEYTDLLEKIVPMIAFSGTLEKTLTTGNVEKYTESSLNTNYFKKNNILINGNTVTNISESQTASTFKLFNYSILVVASKFQTGFDDKYLGCMYVLKAMHDRTIVQTYSRLNRTCETKAETESKNPRIIDFVNSPDDVLQAYSTYYTSTRLKGEVEVSGLFDTYGDIERHNVISKVQINQLCKMYDDQNKDELIVSQIANSVQSNIDALSEDDQLCVTQCIGRFVRNYINIRKFIDVDLMATVRNYNPADLMNMWKALYVLRNSLRKKDRSLIIEPDSIEMDDAKIIDIYSTKSVSDNLKQGKAQLIENDKVSNQVNLMSLADKTLSEFIERFNLAYNISFSNAEKQRLSNDIKEHVKRFIDTSGGINEHNFDLKLEKYVERTVNQLAQDRLFGIQPRSMLDKLSESMINSEEEIQDFSTALFQTMKAMIIDIDSSEDEF